MLVSADVAEGLEVKWHAGQRSNRDARNVFAIQGGFPPRESLVR